MLPGNKQILENNLDLFVNQIGNMETEETLLELLKFTELSLKKRDKVLKKSSSFPHIQKNGTSTYQIKNNGKIYQFSCLSDGKVLDCDKKWLENFEEREYHWFFRSIQIGLSKELIQPKLSVVVGKRLPAQESLHFIVEYQQNQKSMIIDYKNNLVMAKDDYDLLFETQYLNQVDASILNTLTRLWLELEGNLSFSYLLLFPQEILKELDYLDPSLTEKYTIDGIHSGNDYAILSDSFLEKSEDFVFSTDILNKIMEFTENPNLENKDFTCKGPKKYGKNLYLYKKEIPFYLLSDFIPEWKEILLSENRYGLCHEKSPLVLQYFSSCELVSAKMYFNPYRSWYHTWVEAGESVIDFTKNLVMKKEDFYRLADYEIINRTPQELFYQNIIFEENLGIDLPPFYLGYLSQELSKDLERNQFLIKKL